MGMRERIYGWIVHIGTSYHHVPYRHVDQEADPKEEEEKKLKRQRVLCDGGEGIMC